jgi:hypothetical protein
MESLTVAQLKEILTTLNVAKSGNKAQLQARLKDTICSPATEKKTISPSIVAPPLPKPLLMLKVPFQQKDFVKGLGAQWSPKDKKWFVDNTPENKLKFAQWVDVFDAEYLKCAKQFAADVIAAVKNARSWFIRTYQNEGEYQAMDSLLDNYMNDVTVPTCNNQTLMNDLVKKVSRSVKIQLAILIYNRPESKEYYEQKSLKTANTNDAIAMHVRWSVNSLFSKFV